MNEQNWTREPWGVGWNGGLTGPRCSVTVWLDDNEKYVVIHRHNRLVAIIPYGSADADAARIVACVNALASIPDPAGFVEKAKANEAYIADLNKTLNALQERAKKMEEHLKDIALGQMQRPTLEGFARFAIEHAKEALSEGK